jgi:hypothetical protein
MGSAAPVSADGVFEPKFEAFGPRFGDDGEIKFGAAAAGEVAAAGVASFPAALAGFGGFAAEGGLLFPAVGACKSTGAEFGMDVWSVLAIAS